MKNRYIILLKVSFLLFCCKQISKKGSSDIDDFSEVKKNIVNQIKCKDTIDYEKLSVKDIFLNSDLRNVDLKIDSINYLYDDLKRKTKVAFFKTNKLVYFENKLDYFEIFTNDIGFKFNENKYLKIGDKIKPDEFCFCINNEEEQKVYINIYDFKNALLLDKLIVVKYDNEFIVKSILLQNLDL